MHMRQYDSEFSTYAIATRGFQTLLKLDIIMPRQYLTQAATAVCGASILALTQAGLDMRQLNNQS